ncbi:MAG: Ig-like domain-containing protein, partial [Myxococcota bacterium]|nr:Ig-like domain-containing protein [Myxococcota bacterium]
MPLRLALGCTLALFACGRDVQPAAPDGGGGDDASNTAVDDASSGDADPLSDATEPDGTGPDVTAPTLVTVTPPVAAEAWLREPIRYQFDEPITIAGVSVTAGIAGSAVPATVALEGDRTIAVTIDPTASGVGSLELELTGSIVDLAGNAAAPVSSQHPLAPWSRPGTDRGAARGAPALAVAADDASVTAAWVVEVSGVPHVVVSRHRGAWQALGGTLGSDVSSVALAIDDSGRPVVGWIEGGVARVSRWSGSAWDVLPSPGAGAH